MCVNVWKKFFNVEAISGPGVVQAVNDHSRNRGSKIPVTSKPSLVYIVNVRATWWNPVSERKEERQRHRQTVCRAWGDSWLVEVFAVKPEFLIPSTQGKRCQIDPAFPVLQRWREILELRDLANQQAPSYWSSQSASMRLGEKPYLRKQKGKEQ